MKNDAAYRAKYYAKIRKQPGEINSDNDDCLLKHIEIMSRGDVAKALNISRQAVHQIERRAMFKIRKALQGHYDELRSN